MSTEKLPEALRTIGEVSEQLDVPTHVLRFWESKFKQVKPHKRRNRRYYRPHDITVIKNIKTLLYHEGYTIKGVQKFLANHKDLHGANSNDKGNIQASSLGRTSTEKSVKSNHEIKASKDATRQQYREELQQVLTGLQNLRQRLCAGNTVPIPHEKE